MLPEGLLTVIYLAAAVLFILSLGGLSREQTARRGNICGIVGMALAIGATLFHDPGMAYHILVGAVAAGAVIGIIVALRVAMTAMPELVAMLHSFVGLAAVAVGFAVYLDVPPETGVTVYIIEIYVAVAVGAITFTGSVVAWSKLSGRVSGAPLL